MQRRARAARGRDDPALVDVAPWRSTRSISSSRSHGRVDRLAALQAPRGVPRPRRAAPRGPARRCCRARRVRLVARRRHRRRVRAVCRVTRSTAASARATTLFAAVALYPLIVAERPSVDGVLRRLARDRAPRGSPIARASLLMWHGVCCCGAATSSTPRSRITAASRPARHVGHESRAKLWIGRLPLPDARRARRPRAAPRRRSRTSTARADRRRRAALARDARCSC